QTRWRSYAATRQYRAKQNIAITLQALGRRAAARRWRHLRCFTQRHACTVQTRLAVVRAANERYRTECRARITIRAFVFKAAAAHRRRHVRFLARDKDTQIREYADDAIGGVRSPSRSELSDGKKMSVSSSEVRPHLKGETPAATTTRRPTKAETTGEEVRLPPRPEREAGTMSRNSSELRPRQMIDE
ncbi:unnamed protein product, partial [Laminaria digitata]